MGIQKGINAKHCVLIILEKLKCFEDKGISSVFFITDFSKAFDFISIVLIVSK